MARSRVGYVVHGGRGERSEAVPEGPMGKGQVKKRAGRPEACHKHA